MKKLFACLLLVAAFIHRASAQTATLHISVANTSSSECTIYVPGYSLNRNFLKRADTVLVLDKQKKATYTTYLTRPLLVHAFFDSDPAHTKSLAYSFFLSPGDNLYFKADFNQANNGLAVSGKGSNNNQPLLATYKTGIDLTPFKKDSLPNNALAAINKQYALNKSAFDAYTAKYKPSAAFTKYWRYNLAYYTLGTYNDLKGEVKFYADEQAYRRNAASWDRVADSLTARVKFSNDDALIADNYTSLLSTFLLRKKEALWDQSSESPAAFYKEWYNTNAEEGAKLFEEDNSNLLREKIIRKYFTGQTAAYAYALLFESSLRESNPKNLVQIFERFKRQYPGSEYIPVINPYINAIVQKEQRQLTGEMIFAEDNGSKLNNFDELLKLTKGKTVLLDMWGTWCGPCRMELENSSPAIKAHFKTKGLNYLYVANYDMANEKIWKKLIAYFELQGTHVLANEKLTADIMAKVQGRGYPTYVIIKKDGTYELSKAGFPVQKEVLIKQLEEALAAK